MHDRHHSPAFSSLVQTMTAGVIVAILAILGIDPLVGVFGSMAGVATVGMVPLMLTTSVAVLVYFMHHREQADGRVWQTRLAPMLACLGLLASLWLVLTNFTLVTGGSAALSTMLAAIPFAGLLVGACCGGRHNRCRMPGPAEIRHPATRMLRGSRLAESLLVERLPKRLKR